MVVHTGVIVDKVVFRETNSKEKKKKGTLAEIVAAGDFAWMPAFVAVALLSGSIDAIAQSPIVDPVPRLSVTGTRGIVPTPLVWTVSQSSAANSAGPVLIGAAAGAVVGAFVGNALGGSRSCADSPKIGCPQPRIGTLSGAVVGALVGGIAGYFFGRHGKE